MRTGDLRRENVIFVAAGRAEPYSVTVQSRHPRQPIELKLASDLPAGWKVDSPDGVATLRPGEQKTLMLRIVPPADMASGTVQTMNVSGACGGKSAALATTKIVIVHPQDSGADLLADLSAWQKEWRANNANGLGDAGHR